jgi:hypothetical protein
MPLYRIRGTVSFDRAENGETVHYENQALDAEIQASTPKKALDEAMSHLKKQGISNIKHVDGPRYYEWREHELGQGWQEVANG